MAGADPGVAQGLCYPMAGGQRKRSFIAPIYGVHPAGWCERQRQSAQAFMARVAKMDVDVCPCCKVGHLPVMAVLLGRVRLLSPAHPSAPLNRGPP